MNPSSRVLSIWPATVFSDYFDRLTVNGNLGRRVAAVRTGAALRIGGAPGRRPVDWNLDVDPDPFRRHRRAWWRRCFVTGIGAAFRSAALIVPVLIIPVIVVTIIVVTTISVAVGCKKAVPDSKAEMRVDFRSPATAIDFIPIEPLPVKFAFVEMPAGSRAVVSVIEFAGFEPLVPRAPIIGPPVESGSAVTIAESMRPVRAANTDTDAAMTKPPTE